MLLFFHILRVRFSFLTIERFLPTLSLSLSSYIILFFILFCFPFHVPVFSIMFLFDGGAWGILFLLKLSVYYNFFPKFQIIHQESFIPSIY